MAQVFVPMLYQNFMANDQWELQASKMEVLYYVRPYFLEIFSYIGLQNWPYMW